MPSEAIAPNADGGGCPADQFFPLPPSDGLWSDAQSSDRARVHVAFRGAERHAVVHCPHLLPFPPAHPPFCRGATPPNKPDHLSGAFRASMSCGCPRPSHVMPLGSGHQFPVLGPHQSSSGVFLVGPGGTRVVLSSIGPAGVPGSCWGHQVGGRELACREQPGARGD